MSKNYEIVQDTDPRRVELESLGYQVVGESWGARLRFTDQPDLTLAYKAMKKAQDAGFSISELDADWAEALHDLEQANNADYPFTPATQQGLLTLEAARDLWRKGNRVFGATSGDLLIGVTVVSYEGIRGETDFTSVLADYRGKGVGAAVKAASIIALAEDGVRIFGSGGARVNEAILRTNKSLGYIVEEHWLSYQLP